MENFLEDPERIADLSRADLAALLAKTKSLEGAILAKLLLGDAQSAAPSNDRNLNADQIAAALGQSHRWVFRHAKTLPFITRTSRKSLVGSESGLRRWLKARRA